MKLIPLASALAMSTMLSTATAATSLDTLEQRMSYIMGSNFAAQLKNDGINLDVNAFTMAVEDVKNNRTSALSIEEMQKAIAEFKQFREEKAAQKLAEASAEHIKAGAEYLEANAKKEGVVVTSSGLQYKEVTAGDGAIPTAGQKVKVHYHGTLLDGTVFDSSYDRGAPATFGVTQVIKGWVEALQLMNVGDKFELAIPSELAYGNRGAGGKIKPGMTLLFDVELLEIVK